MVQNFCYFHPYFTTNQRCKVCERFVCTSCMKKTDYCFACAPLIGKEKKYVILTYVKEEDITIPVKRRELKTHKIAAYGYFTDESGNPISEPGQDVKTFSAHISIHDFLTLPPISDLEKKIINPLTVYFDDAKFGLIRSIWNGNKLVATGVNIRDFTTIFKKFLYVILLGLLSYIISRIYYLTRIKHETLLNFFKNMHETSLPLLIILFLLFIWIFFRYFVLPSRWSPDFVEKEGRITGYKPFDWNFGSSGGHIAFLTIETLNGEEKILLEWSKRKRIKGKDINKEISKETLDELKNKKWVRFRGKELFNVLVCNYDSRFCDIEVVGDALEMVEPSPESPGEVKSPDKLPPELKEGK